MTRIYFDHNASTPLDPAVLQAMLPYLTDRFGNASSIHSWGREVKKAVEDARELVAALIGASPREVLFTSGGTEANNLAILGTARAHRGTRRKLVTSSVEHSSVAKPCKALAGGGWDVVWLPVKPDGRVEPEVLAAAVDDRTLLVSVMLANNETGAIQPIAELARIAHERGALFHTDAVQAPGKIDVDAGLLGADLLSLGGHKFHGPHGVGALFARRGLELEKLLHGADHERNLRPGTSNTPAIVGFGSAAALAKSRCPADAERVGTLVRRLEEAALGSIPGSHVNGPPREGRLPNTLNLRIDGVEGETMLLALDMEGIAISTGSACHSGGVDPSPVLLAMGLERAQALSSIRISLGRTSSEEEVERFLEALSAAVARQREDGSR